MRSFPLMIFAAGYGTRMGALTADRPKPLIAVAGQPLIDRALALAAGRAHPIVVNLHHLGAQIEQHLAGRDIRLSWERGEILDTGGGLKAALPLLGPGPVMTLNPDAVWTGPNPLDTLAGAWRDEMAALLLVAPPRHLHGRARGAPADFTMGPDGRLTRAEGAQDGVVYLGAQILRPVPVAARPETIFSLNRIWDELIAAGRLFGVTHPGGWCDVGTPEGIAAAADLLGEVGHG